MRLDESVRRLSAARDEMNAFEKQCETEECTDTGELWLLVGQIDNAINDVLNAWNS